MSENDFITIKGARVNNLKNIDVRIPRNKLVVITGLSGSGKSSLAFDTLYAEGGKNVFSRKRTTGEEGQCGRHCELHAVLPERHTLYRTDTYPSP